MANNPGVESANDNYVWDEATKGWKPKEGPEGQNVYFDSTHYVYKDKDGALMFWDDQKYAWFPKIDDDFMAMYQLNYGDNAASSNSAGETASNDAVLPNPDPGPSSKPSETEEAKPKGKRKDPEWFEIDETQNPKVYVSNLPLDITDEELIEFMSKCGLIAKPDGKNYSIKIYKDADDKPKGDALVTYIKVESVDLALQILDGAYLKDKQVNVERAKFTLKGQYDPSKKPRTKKRKDKEKAKKQQERLFSWKLDPLRNVKEEKKSDKVVIVSNAFSPADFEGEKISEILEYSQDFRDEAGKCGNVKKLTVHDRHPEGVVQIWMSNGEEAQAVINLFNNRFFGGRQIQAAIWDGVTKYYIEETEEEREKREKEWVESLQK